MNKFVILIIFLISFFISSCGISSKIQAYDEYHSEHKKTLAIEIKQREEKLKQLKINRIILTDEIYVLKSRLERLD